MSQHDNINHNYSGGYAGYNDYSGERTVMMPGSNGGNQPHPFEQGYNPDYRGQNAYQQPYQQPGYGYQRPQPIRNNASRGNNKSSNVLLWVAICLSIIAISAVVTFLILNRNDKREAVLPENNSAVVTSTAVNQSPHSSPSRINQEVELPEAEQLAMPDINFWGTTGESLASAVLSGNYLNTYRGITAASFHNLIKRGKVRNNRGSSFLQLTRDGITYSYIFKNGNIYNDKARLTSISAEVNGGDDPWLSSDAFDSYVENHGCTLAARDAKGRCIYRTPDGNYVSSGYANNGTKFVVYFYYELFENSLIDNAAPRK